MGSHKKEMVPLEEAEREVEAVCRRIALLHLSYAKTLIEEFGEQKGTDLALKAIKDYGKRIGEKTREEVIKKGLKPTPENFNVGESLKVPKFGIQEITETVEVDGEKRLRTFGCALAKLWKEYGEEKIGRLYCYVDTAKYIAYNHNYKMMHIKAQPDHDECCEFAVRPTTKKDRKDFTTKNKDWRHIDKD